MLPTLARAHKVAQEDHSRLLPTQGPSKSPARDQGLSGALADSLPLTFLEF